MEIPAPDEIERLIQELKDDRRDVRSRAAYELGKLGDPRAIAPLVAALSDQDKFVRSWAAGALGKAGAAAIPPLLNVLQGADASAAPYAALALGELGDVRAIPLLASAIQEGDWDIRPSAAAALTGLGDPDSLPRRVLVDESLAADDRARILSSLSTVNYSDGSLQIRYDLPNVSEFCREYSKSDDERERTGAVAALQSLESAAILARPTAESAPPAVAEQTTPSTASGPSEPAGDGQPEAPPPDKPRRSLLDRMLGR